MAKSILEELVTVLGFEIDDNDLKAFNELTAKAEKAMKRLAALGGVAAAGINVFVNSVANATDETFKFSQTLGVSFQEMQRLIFASKQFRGSASGVIATLTNLQRISRSALRGTGGGEIFGFFGIDPGKNGKAKNPIALLGEMADKLRALGTAAEQAEFAQKFGIDENLILLMRQGASGIARLGAELDTLGFVISDEQAERASEFVLSLVKAKEVVKGLGDVVGLRLAPRVDEMVKSFVEWRKANDELVGENLEKFLVILEKMAGPAKIIAGVLTAMLIGANLANIAIGAVAVTFAALVDDINQFRKGEGDTLTGRTLEKLPGLGAASGALSDLSKLSVGSVIDAIAIVFSKLFGADFGGPAVPGFGPLPGPATTSNTTNIEANININGAGDPGQTGLRVREAIEEMNRNALAGVAVGTGT